MTGGVVGQCDGGDIWGSAAFYIIAVKWNRRIIHKVVFGVIEIIGEAIGVTEGGRDGGQVDIGPDAAGRTFYRRREVTFRGGAVGVRRDAAIGCGYTGKGSGKWITGSRRVLISSLVVIGVPDRSDYATGGAWVTNRRG